jgi:Domain of unknown function (DUF4129)
VSALASALLYLLSLNAVASALLAWGRATPLRLVGWAVGLGLALALGERLGGSLATIEAKRRSRLGVFLGTIHLSVLVLALVLAAASPTPRLLRFLANVLCGYQLLVLLLVRLTPHPRGVVGHSLALTALASLGGGALAAWAASSALGLTGLFVGLDHHRRLLSAHRLPDGPYVGRALWRTALLVLPVAVVVGLAVHRAAPARGLVAPPAMEEGFVPLDEQPKQGLDTRALRAVVVTGLMGAVAVYFVGRWLVRSKRGAKRTMEAPEPLRGEIEPIPEERRGSASLPEYHGRRGRIVRAYLNLLRGAERAGFPRRPDETPREFARALEEPRPALGAATERFVVARYGPYDVDEGDVAEAESAADAVLGHLARHPPRRRARVVRDVGDSSDWR